MHVFIFLCLCASVCIGIIVLLLLSLSSGVMLPKTTVIFSSSFLSSPHLSLTTFSITSVQLILAFAVVLHSPPTLSIPLSTQLSHRILGLPRLLSPSTFCVPMHAYTCAHSIRAAGVHIHYPMLSLPRQVRQARRPLHAGRGGDTAGQAGAARRRRDHRDAARAVQQAHPRETEGHDRRPREGVEGERYVHNP